MSQSKGDRQSILVLMTLLTMPLLMGCQSVKLDGVDEMLEHPEFPKAAKHAPNFTRAVLKKLADTEAMVESQ